jgi:predicted N-acetyltransferase YhbS
MTLCAPEPLTSRHDLSAFSCGEGVLDDWLRRRAGKNQHMGASRTYVVCEGDTVVGYYSLAVGSVDHALCPGSVRRNMPAPVPVMILARLAVDMEYGGRHIGTALVRDAVLRTLQAADIAGIRAVMVHALHDRAGAFYASRGFLVSPEYRAKHYG